MKYLKKFKEGFDYNKDWEDMSKEEREETGIPAYRNVEDDIDFIITKIKEKYPKGEVNDKSDLIDMIVWFEEEFQRDIKDEDKVIDILTHEYNL
jgi:hypothetical protein